MRKKLFAALNILAGVSVFVVAVFLFMRYQEAEDREMLKKDPGLQSCMGHLTKIGEALKEYAKQNNGKYPLTLKALLDENFLEETQFLDCPEKHFRYLYLYDAALPYPCSPSLPLVIDRLSSHRGYINILYADFQVKSEPIEKRKYTRVAVRKTGCTEKEQKILKKRLREFDKAFFQKDED